MKFIMPELETKPMHNTFNIILSLELVIIVISATSINTSEITICLAEKPTAGWIVVYKNLLLQQYSYGKVPTTQQLNNCQWLKQ